MADRFRERAPGVVKLLMQDFELDKYDGAAIVGNLGGESRLEAVQEGAPISGRGGFGWAQWTGPRRVQFENYCSRNNLDITSDKANYAFLFVELKGPESAAISALKATQGLENKVMVFEQKFERAGIKNYAGRIRYAKIALEEFEKSQQFSPVTKAATATVATAVASSTPMIASNAGYTPTQIMVSMLLAGMVTVILLLLHKLNQCQRGK